jgi:hypothetical protein
MYINHCCTATKKKFLIHYFFFILSFEISFWITIKQKVINNKLISKYIVRPVLLINDNHQPCHYK